MPVMALFILFDIVIHDPKHPENPSNLALLDVGAGHFSRMEYASGSSLPGSLIAEFASIAREYVHKAHRSRRDDISIPSTWWQSAPTAPIAPVESRRSRNSAGQLASEEQVELQSVSYTPSLTFFVKDIGSAETRRQAQVSSTGFESQTSISMEEALRFPINNTPQGIGDELMVGTDIMHLFNYFIPGIDPVFYQALHEESGFSGSN